MAFNVLNANGWFAQMNNGVFIPSNSTWYNGYSTENQYAVIIDLLSAGEIEGIVGGIGGVYLNGTSLLAGGDLNLLGKNGIVSVSGTSLTVPTGFFDNIDLSDGDRYIQIKNAGTSSTISAALNAGAKTVSVSSFFNSIWTSSVLREGSTSPMDVIKYTVRIPGAGPDGSEYAGIVTSGNSSSITVYPPISTAVTSGTSIYVDGIAKISSINSATSATLDTSLSTVTDATALLSFAVGNSELEIAYDNIIAEVQRGSVDQALSETTAIANVPSASYVIAPNQELDTHTAAGGTASTYTLPSTAFSFGQSSREEIDKILLNMAFPGGLYHIGGQGANQLAVCEFQVTFKYKKSTSDTEWLEELVVGKDYGTNGDGTEKFYANLPAWPSTQKERFESALTKYLQDSRSYTANSGMIYKTSSETPFIHQFTIDLTPFQPFADWQITVKRLTPDNTEDYAREDNTLVAKAVLKTAEAQIADKLSYPTSAYSVVGFSAQDFETPPARAFHLRGKKIKVPSNYFTREEIGSTEARYTRVINTDETVSVDSSYVPWDGTFRGDLTQDVNHPNFNAVYCNNPAWVYYDILTNPDYGLGDFISEDDIDIYGLYQIARYCDELVDDGKGGQEPRFTCNAYLQSQAESYKVLKDLASTFRSMMYWIDGKITLIQDRPKEAVYTFTQGNIENGVFEYTYTGQRARINQVNVSYNNPDEFYKQTIVTIDDVGNQVEQERIVSKDVVAFGCTSEGQARRVGKWHLLTDTEETELVSFNTGINASFLRPGDIINVQDHREHSVQFGGRIASGSTTSTIELDREVSLESGETYNLHIIIPETGIYLAQEYAQINNLDYYRGDLVAEDADGNSISSEEDAANLVDDSGDFVATQYSKTSKVEKREISSVGDVTSISVSVHPELGTYFSSAPAADTIWAISRVAAPSDAEIKKYRILSISEEESGTKYSVTASIFYEPKFDEMEVGYPIYVPTYNNTAGKDALIPPPTELTFNLRPIGANQEAGASTALSGSISWTPPEETITDSLGSSYTVPYRFIKGYEVQHNITQENTSGVTNFTVGKNSNQVDLQNIKNGTYTVRVRTISSTGGKSRWTTITREISSAVASAPKIGSVARGGHFIKQPRFNKTTGLFALGDPYNYSFTSVSGQVYEGTFADPTEAEVKQAFSILDKLDEYDDRYINRYPIVGYLVFDASEANLEHTGTSRDPWKIAIEHTDEFVQDAVGNETNFKYLKLLSSGDDIQTNGLRAIYEYSSGTETSTIATVSTTAGSSTLTGTNTNFVEDFVVGQLIKVQTDSDPGVETTGAEYKEVVEIISETSLRVRNVFEQTRSTAYAFRRRYPIDIAADCIVAKITKEATFDIEWYATFPFGETADTTIVPSLYAYFPLEKLEVVKQNTEIQVDPTVSLSTTSMTVTQGTYYSNLFKYNLYGYSSANTSFGSIDSATLGDYTLESAVFYSHPTYNSLYITVRGSNPVDKNLWTTITIDTAVGPMTLQSANAGSKEKEDSGTYYRTWTFKGIQSTLDLSNWDGSGNLTIVFGTQSTSIGTPEEVATYDIFFKDTIGDKQAIPTAGESTSIATDSPLGLAGSYRSTATDGITLLSASDAATFTANPHSISLWFKFDKTFTSSTDKVLLSRDEAEYFEILVRQSSSPAVILKVNESSGLETYTSDPIDIGTWINLVVSVEENYISLFMNGLLIAQSDAYSPSSADRPFVLGCNTQASIQASTDSFVGQINEVRLYEGFLSDGELTDTSDSPSNSSLNLTFPDGTKLAAVQPGEAGADKTYNALNRGIEIVESTGGLVFNEAGSIISYGKTSFDTDSVSGFFIGYEADDNPSDSVDTSGYKVNIGDAEDYFKYDGADIEIIPTRLFDGKTGYDDTTAGYFIGKDTLPNPFVGTYSWTTAGIDESSSTDIANELDFANLDNTTTVPQHFVRDTSNTAGQDNYRTWCVVFYDTNPADSFSDAGLDINDWTFKLTVSTTYGTYNGNAARVYATTSVYSTTDAIPYAAGTERATLINIGDDTNYIDWNSSELNISANSILADTISTTGSVTVGGNLTVNGTTTTINSTTLTVDDKLIELANGATSNAEANGAGIYIAGSAAEIKYNGTSDEWTVNRNINLSSGDLFKTSTSDSDQWEDAYGWGDHSTVGYLTSVSESDVTQHQTALSITESQISDLQNYLVTNTDGSVDSLTIAGQTIAANSDGSVTAFGTTYSYNSDGTIASVDSGGTGVSTTVNSAGDTEFSFGTSDPITVNSDGSLNYPGLADIAYSGNWTDLTGTPTTIAGYGITDAFSGSYADLTNKPSIPANLDDLSDVAITSGVSDGQALLYNASDSSWYNGDVTSGIENLNDLSDVSAASPTNGQALLWNSTSSLWEASTIVTDALQDVVDDTSPQLGGNLDLNAKTINGNGTINITGTITASGDITAFSDASLKSNIVTLDGSKVLSMRGVSFTMEGEEGSGVIAQELEKVAPELVHTHENGIKSVAYGNIVGYLIEAIKLQQKEIEELKNLISK